MTNYSMPWIKLYTEILSDPKMGQMTDGLWRRTMELFLLAGKSGNGGYLPSLQDIAWMLRIDTEQLSREIQELKELVILSEDEDGLYVTNFIARQGADSDAERQ